MNGAVAFVHQPEIAYRAVDGIIVEAYRAHLAPPLFVVGSVNPPRPRIVITDRYHRLDIGTSADEETE